MRVTYQDLILNLDCINFTNKTWIDSAGEAPRDITTPFGLADTDVMISGHIGDHRIIVSRSALQFYSTAGCRVFSFESEQWLPKIERKVKKSLEEKRLADVFEEAKTRGGPSSEDPSWRLYPIGSDDYTVILDSIATANKINTIKELRMLSGLGLKESKDFIESAPRILAQGCDERVAYELEAIFKKAGATIKIEKKTKVSTMEVSSSSDDNSVLIPLDWNPKYWYLVEKMQNLMGNLVEESI